MSEPIPPPPDKSDPLNYSPPEESRAARIAGLTIVCILTFPLILFALFLCLIAFADAPVRSSFLAVGALAAVVAVIVALNKFGSRAAGPIAVIGFCTFLLLLGICSGF